MWNKLEKETKNTKSTAAFKSLTKNEMFSKYISCAEAFIKKRQSI